MKILKLSIPDPRHLRVFRIFIFFPPLEGAYIILEGLSYHRWVDFVWFKFKSIFSTQISTQISTLGIAATIRILVFCLNLKSSFFFFLLLNKIPPLGSRIDEITIPWIPNCWHNFFLNIIIWRSFLAFSPNPLALTLSLALTLNRS